MSIALITGANRGLGLEYVRQYLELGWQVYACTRNPQAAELQALASGQLSVRDLDVTDPMQVDRLARDLGDVPVDVLVNNAGTSGPKDAMESASYSGCGNMDYEIWRQILEVNLLGAFKVATSFHGSLEKSRRGVIVNMSSDLGSVAQNTHGGLYSYRTSKAALNIMTRGFAKDWPRIISIAMAPGWCRTDLGGVGATIAPRDSVHDQIKTIDRLTREQSGRFLDRFGETVPW